ncbi:MAG: ATP-binding domain-containing protein [Gemmatimonadaceae bacterium]|nr:ATP-binding domain-containing protein [Gemmatimonadaceae bacterium]
MTALAKGSGPRMIPTRLPIEVREKPERRAECEVYDALARSLKGGWDVYYSRPWRGIDRLGMEREGEADFVLVHPEYGLLVLEVKGGEISYDAATDCWHSMDRSGFRFRIKDPEAQARRSLHTFLDMFRGIPRWNGRRIPATVGCLFPDCRVTGDLTPALPRRAIADAGDMRSISAWVERRMEDAAADRSARPPGEDGVALIHGFLAPQFHLERPTAATLLQVDREIELLTDTQALVLDLIRTRHRLAIAGAAGTGKTSLARTKAVRLAQEGHRTLLLCWNRPLSRHLAAAVGTREHLTVSSLSALVNRIRRDAKLPTADGTDGVDIDWGVLLEEALDQVSTGRFDAIVVDEGQDFRLTWLPAIERLLTNRSAGTLFVFHDRMQKVQNRQPSIADGLPASDVELFKVLRNTKQIATTFRRLLPDGVVLVGPEGPAVRHHGVVGDVHSKIPELLERLCADEDLRPADIAVLFTDVAHRDRALSEGRIGAFPVVNSDEPQVDHLIADSVRRFKGLEQRAVVLVQPSSYASDDELLYVALSRARSLLVFVDSLGGITEIQKRLEA